MIISRPIFLSMLVRVNPHIHTRTHIPPRASAVFASALDVISSPWRTDTRETVMHPPPRSSSHSQYVPSHPLQLTLTRPQLHPTHTHTLVVTSTNHGSKPNPNSTVTLTLTRTLALVIANTITINISAPNLSTCAVMPCYYSDRDSPRPLTSIVLSFFAAIALIVTP